MGKAPAVASETPQIVETAVALAPSPTLVIDRESVILLVNPALEQQFGYARDEIVGQPLKLLVPDGLAFDGDPPHLRVPGTHRDLVGRRRDGTELPIDIEARPIQTPDGVRVLVSVRRTDTREPRRRETVPHVELVEQLEFEQFAAQLSIEYINLPADQVHDAIRSGIARTCQMLGFDRGSFCEVSPEGAVHDCWEWTADGSPVPDLSPPTSEAFPWTFGRVLAGERLTFSGVDAIPDEVDRASYRAAGIRAAAFLPLSVEGRVVGAVGCAATASGRTLSPAATHRLTVIAGLFAQVLARQQREGKLRRALEECQRLKDRLQAENVSLRKEERELLRASRFVGKSPTIRRLLAQIQRVAPTDATVLLRGETGTGKELLATYIHEMSARAARPMVRVNCAAIPTTLIESELFGRERGAFTGALARQVGRFELADHSTIFLDEIGDLPPEVQVKLLRVLEEHTIERLGSPRPIAIDPRIIAATHVDLERLVAEGSFREDLYYRVNVFPVDVPPLRERGEDIPLLLWRFVEEFSATLGKRIDSIERETIAALQAYSWPGNIRELRNVVERAMIATTSRRLVVTLPSTVAQGRPASKLIEVEREHIRGVLATTGWRIRGPGGAAERLGMKPTTLETRIAKLGLRRPGR